MNVKLYHFARYPQKYLVVRMEENHKYIIRKYTILSSIFKLDITFGS